LFVKDGVSPDMIKKMNKDPIIFAMANPIRDHARRRVACQARCDHGDRTSDYPNQVNNVLGFPFIFRGAFDTMATTINER